MKQSNLTQNNNSTARTHEEILRLLEEIKEHEERKKKPFTSYEEMCERIDFLRAPDKLIAKRIELELTDPNQKYRLFTRPPIAKGFHNMEA